MTKKIRASKYTHSSYCIFIRDRFKLGTDINENRK